MILHKQNRTAFRKSSWFCTLKLVNENGEPLRLSEREKIIFGIKSSCNDSVYVIRKILTSDDEINGAYPICCSPEELSIVPKRYSYDVGVQYEDGTFIRIVPESDFYVKTNITEKEEE